MHSSTAVQGSLVTKCRNFMPPAGSFAPHIWSKHFAGYCFTQCWDAWLCSRQWFRIAMRNSSDCMRHTNHRAKIATVTANECSTACMQHRICIWLNKRTRWAECTWCRRALAFVALHRPHNSLNESCKAYITRKSAYGEICRPAPIGYQGKCKKFWICSDGNYM